jgi:cobalt transporter subunit CbtA
MALFRTIVLVAGLVGLVAGLLLTGLQAFTTVPLILEAELYESGAGGHDHASHDHGTAAGEDEAVIPAADVAVEEEGWAPQDGAERWFFTGAANVLTGIGFALLLGAAAELKGGIRSWRQGVFWGLAGFAVFTLAPGLGLPPELPAMPAGDLGDRQVWWVMTVVLTAGGIALLAFGRTIPLSLLAVALIVAPHVIGAPQPDSFESPIPEGLHHDFVVAAVASSFVFWVAIGGLTGVVRSRFAANA